MLTVFLPMRKGSERVPSKNIKKFATFSNGLMELKLKQLIATPEVDKIIVSTDDEVVIKYCNSLLDSKVVVDRRADYLCSSSTETDQLIDYVATLGINGDIMWTHVTSPMISSGVYSEIISTFYNMPPSFDSLMTVSKIQKHLWLNNKPFHNNSSIKWPRTQTLEPIYEINSGVFLANSSIYLDYNDRIGINPYLFQMNSLRSIDIDEESDFLLAEYIWEIVGEI